MADLLPIVLEAELSADSLAFDGDIYDDSMTFDGEIGTAIIVQNFPNYDGAVEFTPVDTTQTIATAGKVLSQNITINPIPSNYGKISWNGSVLTVS